MLLFYILDSVSFLSGNLGKNYKNICYYSFVYLLVGSNHWSFGGAGEGKISHWLDFFFCLQSIIQNKEIIYNYLFKNRNIEYFINNRAKNKRKQHHQHRSKNKKLLLLLLLLMTYFLIALFPGLFFFFFFCKREISIYLFQHSARRKGTKVHART